MPKNNPKDDVPIQAVIFDMDGVIIDSMPLWRKTFKELFTGIGSYFDKKLWNEVKGKRVDEIIQDWYRAYPWKKPSQKKVAEIAIRKMVSKIRDEGNIRPGTKQLLTLIKRKNYPIGIASSSNLRIISEVLKKFDLKNYFDIIYSAQSEKFGKPHPGVYITAARKLNADPKNCVVIEDSLNGILAAKSAQMYCIAVPNRKLLKRPEIKIADRAYPSLRNLNAKQWKIIKKEITDK